MAVDTNQEKIEELLTRGVENIYPSREFLEDKLKSGEKLTLYLGIDPTGPTLHLGNAVQLLKLAQFQALGHKIILLTGDFTAMIGDPTDKTATRKKLSRDEVMENCKLYKDQAARLIDIKKTELKYNSKWLGKLTFTEVIDLASEFTVQRMLERDMFENRMKEGKPIYVHEFMYPLMQGYDSLAMDVDGEVGGNDQTFNMLAGRTLMKSMKGKEKFVLTNKLLVDPTGKKMGKTEGNMVTLQDPPEEMFGKVMSWPDEMMPLAFELITKVPMGEIKELEAKIAAGENPRDIKLKLAFEVVKLFIGEEEANAAQDHFVRVISNKEQPEEIEEKAVTNNNIVEALVETGLASSKSEARRLIEQKGVKVNDQVVESLDFEVKSGDVIQKGKRFFVKIR
jgi:tyrosyl-tRNA synthetase